MAITVTSREFNQRASQILKISETQPVFITKWGKIVSVLSSYTDYVSPSQKGRTLAEAFSQPHDAADIDDFDLELDAVRHSMKFRVTELEE